MTLANFVKRDQSRVGRGEMRDKLGAWDKHIYTLLHSGSAGKESASNVGDLDSIPGLGRCPGEGKGYSLQYSGPEDSVDCVVHGVTKSLTQQSDCSLIKVM